MILVTSLIHVYRAIYSDSALDENNGISTRTSAGLTLCILDIKANESIVSREWENRPVIPILASAAFCMQEECLEPIIPRGVIMDSSSVRNRALMFREGVKCPNREYVRGVIMNGIEKPILSRMEWCLDRWRKAQRHSVKNGTVLELENRLKKL